MSIREIIAAICIFIGLFVFLCSILGIYRFKYAMNRMHAAALGDTMGIFFVVLGLLILGQDIFHMAKYALIILFFWLSSPISTHLIAKVELLTNKDCGESFLWRLSFSWGIAPLWQLCGFFWNLPTWLSQRRLLAQGLIRYCSS